MAVLVTSAAGDLLRGLVTLGEDCDEDGHEHEEDQHDVHPEKQLDRDDRLERFRPGFSCSTPC